ncbi:ATP-binding protein [Litorivicinus lipolyticus]|uniref:ATP-binding protein n=1 Tax=Litorivicinus lipolyticus TaxID=418701 RepID=UPI001FE8F582|nr:ATP-binding protein [Litorivicinus lipolyticus]
MLSSELNARLLALLDRLEPALPPRFDPVDFEDVLAVGYQSAGVGGGLVPMQAALDQRFSDLLAMDRQQQQFRANAELFLKGWPCNHVLLWGARGTGKSSLVRALLTDYHDRGLRLIEFAKADLGRLPQVLAQLADLPYHFVVFCDDLSFESGDTGYQALKTVLEGSIASVPSNLMVVATSNRKHLVPELAADNLASTGDVRDGGEVHLADSINERISLADRFGLSLSFYQYAQADYLDICRHAYGQMAAQVDIALPKFDDQMAIEASRFAIERGGRGGRVAHQFVRDWVARWLMAQS